MKILIKAFNVSFSFVFALICLYIVSFKTAVCRWASGRCHREVSISRPSVYFSWLTWWDYQCVAGDFLSLWRAVWGSPCHQTELSDQTRPSCVPGLAGRYLSGASLAFEVRARSAALECKGYVAKFCSFRPFESSPRHLEPHAALPYPSSKRVHCGFSSSSVVLSERIGRGRHFWPDLRNRTRTLSDS